MLSLREGQQLIDDQLKVIRETETTLTALVSIYYCKREGKKY